ncbi:MAG TPA: NAD(P)-dependent oxidoreductase [Nitrososphaeria archaeon]|nr:NAD(P)-dependent oxidoreductase [Nitrososphaeria archaeon]
MTQQARVALIGLGKMGKTILHHLQKNKYLRLVLAAEVDLARGEAILRESNLRYAVAKSDEEVARAIERDAIALVEDASLALQAEYVDVIIDATGNIEFGAWMAWNALSKRINMVMLNAEADATVGPILSRLADSAGAIYTGDIGDEPGTIMHYLYKPLTEIGLEVLVAGKGKNNPLNPRATPRDLVEESSRKGLNPRILTSFVDGTKTMVEMTILSNATGLLPDVRGMHGPSAGLSDLVNIFRLRSEGGILNAYNVVDYVIGIAPGVFAIARSDDEIITSNLEYLKLGNGPSFLFYRPYHLPGSETILSAIYSIKYKEPVIKPKGYYSETIAVAKRDLSPGDKLDGVGGFTVYGLIERRRVSRQEGLLPIGLAKNCIMRRSKRAGEVIRIDDVEIPETFLYDLWRIQEKICR